MIDTDVIQRIKDRAASLRGLYATRDSMYEEIRQMVHMEWGADKPQADWIKPTLSPSAYNAVMGAVRLMTSTEPQFSVPFEESDADGRAVSEKIEQAARYMWAGSGRVSLRPVHYEMVFSALTFGEMAASVTRTADMLAHARGTGNAGLIRRMEMVNRTTPYVFIPHNPATVYPDLDVFGLRGCLRRAERTWGEVESEWGQYVNVGARKAHDKVTVNDWYDWEHRVVWTEPGDTLYAEPHGLRFLPMIDQLADGSMLFPEPERQRLPMLYGMYKSDIWRRENLSLTVIYSLIFALGSNPLLLFETDDPDNVNLRVDRTIPGGMLPIRKGERVSGLMEKVLDPSLWQGLEAAQRLGEESTVSKMTLGTAPVQQLAFSAISLLSQSGRLPLVTVKQMCGQAISNLLIAAFEWWRDDPTDSFYGRTAQQIDLRADEIPERLALTVNLEPDVPTDKLQLANIAQRLVDSGLASTRWARENILQIGQSQAMDKEISREKFITYQLQRILSNLSAQDQMAVQQQAAAIQQSMHAQQQEQAMAGQLNGNEGAYLNGAVQPGAPMSGPMQPQGAPV